MDTDTKMDPFLAATGGHEWKDIVHQLQKMGKWPKYTDADEQAAIAALEKLDASE